MQTAHAAFEGNGGMGGHTFSLMNQTVFLGIRVAFLL